MRLKLAIFLAVAALLQSCGEYPGDSVFIKACDAPEGVYRFTVDLSDSLAAYDISFFTHISEPLMLDVNWLSPASVPSLRDSVWMEPKDRKADFALYRSGVCPAEKGAWIIEVRPSSVPKNFIGMGIVCKKNGTR